MNQKFTLRVRANGTISIPVKILKLLNMQRAAYIVQARYVFEKYKENYDYLYNKYIEERIKNNKPISVTMMTSMPMAGQYVNITVIDEDNTILMEPSISSFIANN